MATSRTGLGRGLGGLLGGQTLPATPAPASKKTEVKKPKSSTKKGKAVPKPAAKKAKSRKAPRKEIRRRPAPEVAPQPAAPEAKVAAEAPLEGTMALPEKAAASAEAPTGLREIPVAAITPNPHQPRRDFDATALQELADSIRAEGLLQPIVVRAMEEGQYELIAGERRWRAVQMLRLKRIPVRVIASNDATSAVLSLVENLQRADLNPVEEALGYASLLKDFDLTQETVAERVGKARASVANALRLLQLEREIQGYLAQGRLSTGHAKVLLGLPAGEVRMLLARRVIEQGMSVRALEDAAAKVKEGGASRSTAGNMRSASSDRTAVEAFERALSNHFATGVTIKHTAKKGRLVIEYFGNEDLQRILEKMGVGSV